jgi:hypothetical protein
LQENLFSFFCRSPAPQYNGRIEAAGGQPAIEGEADMRFSDLVAAVCVILFFGSTGAFSAAAQEDAVAQYLHSAGMIKSYDVTFQATLATYPGPGSAPVLGVTERVRDAFADGGRRYERFVGDSSNHTVSVRQSTDTHQAREMMLAITGMNYRDYFDPFVALYQDHGGVKGSVLTELLQNPATQVKRLEVSEMGHTGFEVLNPQLAGSIRLWFDPASGNMPIRIDILATSRSGASICLTRTRISRFAQPLPGVWVPIEGSLLLHANDTGGSGFAMKVDMSQSTWNAIPETKALIAAGVPSVNHSANGWKENLPPTELAAARDTDEMLRRIAQVHVHGWSTQRIVFVSVNCIALLAILAFVFYRRLHRRRTNV